MFDFLKKKIKGFVDKLTTKEEEKLKEKPPEDEKEILETDKESRDIAKEQIEYIESEIEKSKEVGFGTKEAIKHLEDGKDAFGEKDYEEVDKKYNLAFGSLIQEAFEKTLEYYNSNLKGKLENEEGKIEDLDTAYGRLDREGLMEVRSFYKEFLDLHEKLQQEKIEEDKKAEEIEKQRELEKKKIQEQKELEEKKKLEQEAKKKEEIAKKQKAHELEIKEEELSNEADKQLEIVEKLLRESLELDYNVDEAQDLVEESQDLYSKKNYKKSIELAKKAGKLISKEIEKQKEIEEKNKLGSEIQNLEELIKSKEKEGFEIKDVKKQLHLVKNDFSKKKYDSILDEIGKIREDIKDLKKSKKKGFFDSIKEIVAPKKEEKPKVEEIKEPEIIEETTKEVETKPKETHKRPQKKELKPKEVKKEKKVKLGVFEKIKGAVTGSVEIKKDDVSELLEDFELGMIEGDVALEVAEEIKQNLEERLVGKKIKRGELDSAIADEMGGILREIMDQREPVDFVEYVKTNEKPVKIMFLGINGAGKTTTLAKIAHMLQQNDLKVVFAAADTFRAAAIEQIQVHGDKLGVKVIKRPYGSDSTAVVYDAINHAKAHKIDAVLIDTAGRQDNNVDLINELKKMERVIKPDLKIYIGESIAGNSVISQVSGFNEEIGLDGVILTKLDCDPKGGTVISISKVSGVPIFYTTHGQGYEDISKFDPEFIIKNLV